MENHAKTLNVLFVSEYFPPVSQGGGEQSCYLLAKYLARKDVRVTVLTSGRKGLPVFEHRDGFRIVRKLRTGKAPGSILGNITRAIIFPGSVRKETRLLLKEQEFDIIHYFGTTSVLGAIKTSTPQFAHVNSPLFFSPTGIITDKDEQILTQKMSWKLFRKHILHAEEIGKMPNRPWFRYNPLFWYVIYSSFQERLEKLHQMDKLIGPTPFIRDQLIKEGIPKDRISVIPNIVETQPKKEEERKAGKERPLRILYLGSYVKYKGILVLFKAVETLMVPYVCSFFGSGYLRKELERIIAEKKLNVHLHDRIPTEKIGEVFRRNDVVVMPSRVTESFGRIAIEAMSSGIPVIASDIGGLHFIIEHRQDGLLVSPGDASGLVDALMDIYQDKDLRKRLIRNGLKTAKRHRGELIANIVKQAYLDVGDRTGRSRR
ncbi:MAG: glycosyltransferase family 4 protein [DPANN group archaeon]|nr:glycosyltransferase family 4 protein [DPANN group archaeon]